MKQFQWTGKRAQAAQLVAEDRISDELIAHDVGISKRQLEQWKTHPDFIARVRSIVDQMQAAVLARGIADKRNRVDALNDRWRRMRQVIEERSEDPDMTDVPGGQTGLLAMQYKLMGFGKDAQLVREYTVDTGTLKELREHEKQAAQELEQWKESASLLKYIDLSKCTNEQLERLARGDDPIKALLGH